MMTQIDRDPSGANRDSADKQAGDPGLLRREERRPEFIKAREGSHTLSSMPPPFEGWRPDQPGTNR